MAWVRLDDKFWRNEKMRNLSHAARGVFCDSLSYCADTPEPTGYLSYHEASQRGPRRLILELAGNGNLESVNGGYLIHDFEKYIERGSRDRCRAWRERKRAESEPLTNVTVTSPRATGLETISTSGFYPSPSRPEPEGVKPLQDNGLYGLQATAMHVEGLHPLKETLKKVILQSVPHKEAI